MPKEEPVRGLELVTKENVPKLVPTSFDPNPDTFKIFKTCESTINVGMQMTSLLPRKSWLLGKPPLNARISGLAFTNGLPIGHPFKRTTEAFQAHIWTQQCVQDDISQIQANRTILITTPWTAYSPSTSISSNQRISAS